jgi:hypothetical protein
MRGIDMTDTKREPGSRDAERPRKPASPVPSQAVDAETAAVGADPRFLTVLEHSRIRHENEGGIPAAEMRRRLGR